MPWTCLRDRSVFLLLLYSACADDGAERSTDDSGAATSHDATASGAEEDSAPADDFDAGESAMPETDAGDATRGGNEEHDSSRGGARHDADVQLPASEAGATADAGDASRGDPVDGGDPSTMADASLPDLGAKCHDFDFDGVSPLVAREIVSALPSAEGGAVLLGTYDLISEQRVVAAGATPTEAADCMGYEGAYRERLVVTADRWLRLARIEEGTTGRQSFAYRVESSSIVRTQLCPAPDSNLPPSARARFAAMGDVLVVFDQINRADPPDGPKVCEFAYTYKRKP